MKFFYGRIGYDNEGIVRETAFATEAEAKAYAKGADDMKEQADCCEDSPLEDYWTAHSDQESIAES